MSRTKFLSWLFGVAALGFFYTGEALAGLCYKQSSTTCRSLFNTPTNDSLCQQKSVELKWPLGTWKAYSGSCSLSGTIVTFNGSEISCTSTEPVGSITARLPTTPTEKAVWSEFADNVSCTFNGGDPAIFDMFIQYTLDGGTSPSKAQCFPAQGSQALDELRYTGHCGSATPRGYLKYVGTGEPPQWVKDMCINKQGQVQDCQGDYVMALDGSPLTNKGEIDLKKCQALFPSANGLETGQFLLHTDIFPAGSNCGANGQPRLDSTDSKRRMCQNHTFFNPNYDEETGQGPVTLPPCPELKNVAYRGGIGPDDAAQVEGAELYVGQVKPDATVNLSCANEGTLPSTALNSENIALSGFTGTIETWVKNFPSLVAVGTSAPLPDGTGLKINHDRCLPGAAKGLVEVICAAVKGSTAGTVDLVYRGTPSGDGLGFIGEATGVNINNVRNCETISP